MFDILWRGLVIGAGATILMDLWAILLTRFGQAAPNWAPVGRWFWHLRRGKVFHESIADAEPYAQELALGWISHYAVGILYGVIFAIIMGSAWLAAPTFLPPGSSASSPSGQGGSYCSRASASAGPLPNIRPRTRSGASICWLTLFSRWGFMGRR